MSEPSDICPRPQPLPPLPTRPHAPAIFPTSVWECESPQQADAILGEREVGYVDQRDGNPNASLLAEKLRQLQGAERAAVTASGMAALSAALLALLESGDHVIIGSRMYGKTHALFAAEGKRLGIETTAVDTCDLSAVA